MTSQELSVESAPHFCRPIIMDPLSFYRKELHLWGKKCEKPHMVYEFLYTRGGGGDIGGAEN